MLKLSPNALGMLIAKYRSVLKKMFIKNAAALAASCLIFSATPAQAADFAVGTNQAYTTLAALAAAVDAGEAAFQDGDTITIHNVDTSNATLNFSGKKVTIKPVSSNIQLLIMRDKTVTLTNAERVSITGFTTLSEGGAVYLENSAFTANGATFKGNSAIIHGGAVYLKNSTLTADNATFSDNEASLGGAVFLRESALTANGATFSGNTTTTSFGGAAYLSYSTLTANGITFKGNEADNSVGGAAYLLDSTLTVNNATFTGNKAISGGAIYITGESTVNLNTDNGKTTSFIDNKDVWETPNSLTFAGSNGATNYLNVSGAGTLDMRDQMTGSGTGNLNITKTGTGDWKLGGANNFSANGAVGTAFKVNEGALDLYKDAKISISKGSFSLADGAALNSRGGNTVAAPTVTLNDGSTLGFDLTGTTAGGGTTNLTLTGCGVSDNVGIDIVKLNGAGIFNLVTANGGVSAGNQKLTLRGGVFNNTRATGSLSVDTITNTLKLTAGNTQNGEVTWTGGENNLWNATNNNWTGTIGGVTPVTKFLHGDAVVFDAAGGGDIEIQDAGVQIAKQGANPGLIIKSGNWTFTGGKIEGGEINFTGNGGIAFDTRSLEQRIIVDINKTAKIGALDGETLYFDGFDTTAAGGNGGVIYAVSGATIHLSGYGALVFKNNQAEYGAAIDSDGSVLIDSGGNTFSNNSAVKQGGAIWSFKDVTINGGNTFSNNSAGANGGAIYTVSNVTISGDNTFSNNSAGTNGGAIYAVRNVTISGGNTFSNNSAGTQGGAIFAFENATLTADTGDITFRGNTQGTGASQTPNAIYMYNPYNNTLALSAKGGHGIFFYDPMESESVLRNLTVSINNDADDTGTVLFDQHQSKVYGNTTVHNGTMQLTGGAIYGDTGNQSFTLNQGATLLSDVNGNKIQANTITLNNNSILAFDLTGATAGGGTTNLTLTGGSVSDNVDIDIVKLNGAGTFNLVTADGGVGAGNRKLTLRGEGFTNTRANGSSLNVNGNTLTFTATTQNGVVTWTGGENNKWNSTSQNWDTATIDGNASKKFLHGDAVVFDAAGGGVIKIQSAGVQIAKQGANPGLIINSGNWTFTGGKIEGGEINFTGNGGIAFDTRSLAQRIIVDNNKTAKIGAVGGETLYFNGFDTTAADTQGGAIYAKSGTNVHLTGGAFVFKNNQSGLGAAINSRGTVLIDSGGNTFSNNSANYGGAIYGFTGGVTISGGSTFSNNSASTQGGAIWSHNVTISGGNTFSNNSAGWEGGAIFAFGNATLTADTGDITFRGNTQNTRASQTPNAIYMDNRTTNTLALSAKDGHGIFFYDPVESESFWRDLTVSINKYADDTGTVLFDQHQSKVYGNTTVHNGTMQLTGGATYGDSGNPSFTLNQGATLLSDVNGNKIQANTITLNNNSILAFDLTGATAATQNLILTGTTFNGDIGAGTIDIRGTNLPAIGTYTLVAANGATVADTGTVLYNGNLAPTRDLNALFLNADNTNAKLLLDVADTTAKATLTWTGRTPTGNASLWDIKGAYNWSGTVAGHTVKQFLNGDTVTFDDTGTTKNITVQAAGVVIDGMRVNNSTGDYTFSGGSIGGAGALTKTGAGTLTLNNANTYSGGTNLDAGRIDIGNNTALGTNQLSMKSGTTLGFAQNNLEIDNAITITGSATFATGTNIDAAIKNDITGGSFEKIGAGALTIGNATVVNATVSAGNLQVSQGKTLDVGSGTLNVKNGAALSLTADNNHVSAITGSVDFNNSGYLDISGYNYKNYMGNSDDPTGTVVTLIRSTSVVNSPTHYKIGNDDMEADYVTAQVWTEGTNIVGKINLSWYDNHQNSSNKYDQAHGTFTLRNANSYFELGADLHDRGSAGDFIKWDGKTLTKEGLGTLVLTGNNDYSGNTNINGGTLVATNTNALGAATGNVSLTNNSTLEFGLTNDSTFGKQINGDGNLVKSGGKILTLTGSNGYSGSTSITGGTLLATNTNVLGAATGGNVSLANSSTLEFDLTNDSTFGKQINGNGNLVKSGDKTLILTGVNTYSGMTTITEGTLTGNIAANTSLTVESGATYNTGGAGAAAADRTLSALSGAGIVNMQGQNLTVSQGDFGGSITGTGSSLTKTGAGTLTLSGVNTYTGLTELREGTLALSGAGTISDKLSLYGGTTFNTGGTNVALKQLDVRGNANWEGALNMAGKIMHFYLPSDIRANEQMLAVNGTADISNATVNVGIAGSSSVLKVEDKVILINAQSGLTGETNNKTADGHGMQGVTLKYKFDITTDSNQLIATVSGASTTEQSKSLSEGKVSGLASANQGQDFIAGQGIGNAIQSARGQGTAPFAAIGYGNTRYKTGSYVDSSGWSMVAGVAKENPNSGATYGFFLEGGRGNYDTFNSFASGDVNGSGKNRYFGGGVLLRKNGQDSGRGYNYHEGSLRVGSITTDFSSSTAGLGYGDTKSTYYGVHYGFGQVKKQKDGATCDLYGKLFYTHQGGNSVTLDDGNRMDFSSAQSLRAWLGILFTTAPSASGTSFSYGLAYEHEFDGKQNSTINTVAVDAPSMKGGSAIATIGLNHQKAGSNFSMGLDLNGYAGKRQGLGVNAKFKWAF